MIHLLLDTPRRPARLPEGCPLHIWLTAGKAAARRFAIPEGATLSRLRPPENGRQAAKQIRRAVLALLQQDLQAAVIIVSRRRKVRRAVRAVQAACPQAAVFCAKKAGKKVRRLIRDTAVRTACRQPENRAAAPLPALHRPTLPLPVSAARQPEHTAHTAAVPPHKPTEQPESRSNPVSDTPERQPENHIGSTHGARVQRQPEKTPVPTLRPTVRRLPPHRAAVPPAAPKAAITAAPPAAGQPENHAPLFGRTAGQTAQPDTLRDPLPEALLLIRKNRPKKKAALLHLLADNFPAQADALFDRLQNGGHIRTDAAENIRYR